MYDTSIVSKGVMIVSTTSPKGLMVTEGISGYWHYHISYTDSFVRSLCGASTMITSIPLHRWKVPFGEHFPKRPTWCSHCEQLRERL